MDRVRRLRFARWLSALLAVVLAALLTATALSGWASRNTGAGRAGFPAIGLFTSLPILWRETQDLADLVRREVPPHWALPVLEGHGPVRPLDTLLSAPGGGLPLDAGGLLVMAQPRPLSPEENVSLDAWVRGGGHVLLFADPLLTQDSAFALGDRRRPQDVVLLSPILARWGLELGFDGAQPPGERVVRLLGTPLPVNLPGRFALKPGGTGRCRLLADGLAARCRIGKGGVLAIADAALLEERDEAGAGLRSAALDALLQEARPDDRD